MLRVGRLILVPEILCSGLAFLRQKKNSSNPIFIHLVPLTSVRDNQTAL